MLFVFKFLVGMSVLGEILKKIFVDQHKIRNFFYHMHNFAKKEIKFLNTFF